MPLNLIAAWEMSENLVKVRENVSCADSRILPSTIFHVYVAVDGSVFKLCICSFWNLLAFVVRPLQITL